MIYWLKKNILGMCVSLGVLFWIMDAMLDSIYKGHHYSLSQSLLIDQPVHEFIWRILTSILFICPGIVLHIHFNGINGDAQKRRWKSRDLNQAETARVGGKTTHRHHAIISGTGSVVISCLKKNILGVCVSLGVLFWIMDAMLDSIYKGHHYSFSQSLLIDQPVHEFIWRIVIVILLVSLDIIVHIHFDRINGGTQEHRWGVIDGIIQDNIDLISCHFINIKSCRTVCLTLGPYRNLTTLTAATVFLHPNCQILNHAGMRIYGNERIDFISDYNKEKLDRFIKYAIMISTKGERGNYGGSILYSHAFDSKYIMKDIYDRTNSGVLKKQVTCLFWKESLMTSNLIRERNVDLAAIFEKEERLRFLLPIRNPLDCAVSNLKTGHARLFKGLGSEPSQSEVVQAILDEILWFANLQEKYPDRFSYYFEHEISREMLFKLAAFLRVNASESWLNDAILVMKSRSSYQHSSKIVDLYRECVNDRFKHFPALHEGLILFFKKEN